MPAAFAMLIGAQLLGKLPGACSICRYLGQ